MRAPTHAITQSQHLSCYVLLWDLLLPTHKNTQRITLVVAACIMSCIISCIMSTCSSRLGGGRLHHVCVHPRHPRISDGRLLECNRYGTWRFFALYHALPYTICMSYKSRELDWMPRWVSQRGCSPPLKGRRKMYGGHIRCNCLKASLWIQCRLA
jgi:hypothetical protein